MEARVTLALERYEQLKNAEYVLRDYEMRSAISLIKQNKWDLIKHQNFSIITNDTIIQKLVADNTRLISEKDILRNEIQELKQKLFEKENPFFVALIKNAFKKLKNEL